MGGGIRDDLHQGCAVLDRGTTICAGPRCRQLPICPGARREGDPGAVKMALMARASAIAETFDAGLGVEPPRSLGEREIHIWIVPLAPGAGEARSRAAARQIVAGYLGCEPRRVSFWTDRLGKPQVAGGDLHYSLSHAGAVALVRV